MAEYESRRGEATSDSSSSTSRPSSSSSDSSSSDSSDSSSTSYSTSSGSRSSSTSSSSSSSSSGDSTVHDDDVPMPSQAAAVPLNYFVDIPLRVENLHVIFPHAQRGVVKEWSTQLGCWVSRQTHVLIYPKAFARGCMRSSYHLIDLQCPEKNFVAKKYRKSTVKTSQYFDDVAMHSIAEYWALQFNACNVPKRVRFVPAAVLELSFHDPPLVFAIEPHLVGEFKKHNNNNGYVAEDKRSTPQAFSHFTFHKSQGQLLIVDIQGVGDDYTDPQMMSLDGEGYGRGNLGKKGMERFLKTHKCNLVCEHLQLPNISRKKAAGKATPKTKREEAADMPTAKGKPQKVKTPKRTTNVTTPTSPGGAVTMADRMVDNVLGGEGATSPPQHLPPMKDTRTPENGGGGGRRRGQHRHVLRESIKGLRGTAPLVSVAPPPKQPELSLTTDYFMNEDVPARDSARWGALSFLDSSIQFDPTMEDIAMGDAAREEYMKLIERQAKRKADKDTVLLDE